MRLRWAWIPMLVGGVAWATEPQPSQTPTAGAAPEQAQAAREGEIDPKADAALRRMGDYVGGLKSARVDTVTVDEKVTTDGQKIQEVQDSKVTFVRPNKLRVDRVSPRGNVVFRYDGKQYSVFNKDKNVFALAAAPPQLDAAIDEARDKLHIDAPGGDLIVGDPYHALIEGTITGHYIGLEPIDGVMAHHIAVTKKDVDWQIWIKDGPEAVPLRYVITSKDMKTQPQFTLMLRNWQPNASVPADSFTFTPPSGAKRVEFAAPRKTEGPTGGQP
jgi:hypothetical protein